MLNDECVMRKYSCSSINDSSDIVFALEVPWELPSAAVADDAFRLEAAPLATACDEVDTLRFIVCSLISNLILKCAFTILH